MDLTSPLDDGEFDRLAALLRDVGGDATMNLETLDGFFCALVVGPEVVMPSEYLPVVLGTAEPTFDTENQARDLMTLLVRHWNAIASGIEDDGSRVHVPLLLEDDSGIARGNDWARGFLRGVDMRRDAWRPFVDDEEHGGPMIPIFALAYEHDPDPSMRPYKEPMTPEQRDALILHAAAGLIQTRRYFRRFGTTRLRRSDPVRRASAKVGRNDPCPCGSGRKFKHCCGRESLH